MGSIQSFPVGLQLIPSYTSLHITSTADISTFGAVVFTIACNDHSYSYRIMYHTFCMFHFMNGQQSLEMYVVYTYAIYKMCIVEHLPILSLYSLNF